MTLVLRPPIYRFQTANPTELSVPVRLNLSPCLLPVPQNGPFLLSRFGVSSKLNFDPARPTPRWCAGSCASQDQVFLSSKPPQNYVVGLGRGATGLTMRSDIGPARAAPDLPDRSAAVIRAPAGLSGVGRGRGKGPGEEDEEEENEEKGYDNNQKFDEFERNDAGVFASAEYEDEDKGADAVWEAIDKRMDSRRNDSED